MDSSYRPTMHFTPARNWMNDPNGLVWRDGLFHLFFQHNPLGPSHANMSWGHATSADLVTWEEQPIALAWSGSEQVYSGSVVVDHDDSSGFGSDGITPLVAVYTSVSADRQQTQSLAFSVDDGMTWARYEHSPVLDRGSEDFRDPKVFRFEDDEGSSRWVMVAVEAVDRQVLIFSSPDLKDWTLESVIDAPFANDVVVECPDLFPLTLDGGPERRWVLLLSTNTVGDTVDSSMHYTTGGFDGRTFTVDPPDLWRRVDHGRDFYAGVTFDNAPDDRRIAIGWVSNWLYARAVPTSPWRGAMSMPRELSLRTVDEVPTLVQAIPREWRNAIERADTEHHDAVALADPIRMQAGQHFVLDLEWTAVETGIVGVDLLAGESERTRLLYDFGTGALSLDRTRSGETGFSSDFAATSRASVPARDGRVGLHVVVDRSVVEVIADEGAVRMTDLVFPDPRSTDVVLFADRGDAAVSFSLTRLDRPVR